MQSYYALNAQIRYYGTVPGKAWLEKDADSVVRMKVSGGTHSVDPAKWKEPPHVALANLRGAVLLDPLAAGKFTRTYGVLPEFATDPTTDPSLPNIGDLLAHYPEAWQKISLGRIQSWRWLLRGAWRGSPGQLDQIIKDSPETQLAATRDGVVIQKVGDLWTLIWILFLKDRAAGRAKVCANADCPFPYFLRARKGQVFCSHPCAVLVNVRRFRKARRSKSKGDDKKIKKESAS